MNLQQPLKISNPETMPPYQAGKWLEIRLLIDIDEMQSLIQAIRPIFIFRIGKIVDSEMGIVSVEDFLASYKKYIEYLRNSQIPDKEPFTLAFTKDSNDLYALPVGKEKYVIKIARPAIQVLPHSFRYSSADRKIRSMSLGTDAITWGIQISFPQLFENPASGEIEKTLHNDEHPNGFCFRNLQKWIRIHTCTTRFKVDEEVITTSIRLGKQCYSWIHRHPQLKSIKIAVAE